MDLESSFHDVTGLVRSARQPRAGWCALVAYLEAAARRRVGGPLRAIDVDADVASVRAQLTALLRKSRPPAKITAYYFGLFDTLDERQVEGIGYYIAGVERFDRKEPDSLCRPAWFPKGRYLESSLLDAVKKVELEQRDRSQRVSALLGYAGQLGTAALVTKFASARLFGRAPRVVGFDSGDFLELDARAPRRSVDRA